MRSLPDGFEAVVLGSSGGIGAAVAAVLADDPRCARTHRLSRASGFDLLDEASISSAAATLARAGVQLDLIFDATGALQIDGYGPEKSLRSIDAAGMAMQFAVNAIGPALILKHFAPLMPRDRRCLFATLSARVGSIGDNRLGGWISYRASKAALNQIVRTASIEMARTHPQSVVVALHPGTVVTRLSEPFAADRARLTPDAAAHSLLNVLDSLAPHESGKFYAYDGHAIEW